MKVFQKVLISLLLATVVFTGFAIAAYSGLFDLIETRFYSQRVRSTARSFMDESIAITEQYLQDLQRGIGELASDPSIGNVFLINQSRQDIENQERAVGDLLDARPEIDFIRIVDNARGQIWFSTLTDDVRSRSDTRIEYEPVEQLDPPLQLPPPDDGDQGVEWIAQRAAIRIVVPIVDSFSIPRGILVAWVGTSGLYTTLVNEGILGPSSRVRLTPAGNLLVNAPRHFGVDNLAAVDSAVADNESGAVLDSEGQASFAIERAGATDAVPPVLYLINESSLHIDPALQYVLLGAVFLLTFLISYLILNIRQDPTVVVAERFRRFQQSVVRDYLREGRAIDPELWKRELETRKEQIEREIKRGLGRTDEETRQTLTQTMDRNWEELHRLIGSQVAPSGGTKTELEQVSLQQIEAIIERTLARYGELGPSRSARRPAKSSPDEHTPEERVVSGSSADRKRPEESSSPFAGMKPVEVEDVDDTEELDDLEELSEEAEPVAELDAADELEELDDLEELSEEAEPVAELDAADELEELDDLEELSEEAEPVAELDEADELEELDDLDEVEAIEELEDVAELEEAEPADELEELDDLEELSEETEPVAELDAADELEELDDLEELSEEAESVAELDEADELEELDDLEELSEEAEPVAELDEADELEELDDLDEVEAIEELDDVAELEEAELDAADELEELDDLEELSEEAEPVAELDEADELEELDDLEELSEEAEPVAELDEADELEELDDLDEVEAIEELDDVAELEEAEPDAADELDEVEAIEELEDVAELEGAEPADELEELDDLEELSEEAEPVAELDELEELDDLEELSEEAEPVAELDEADELEELDDLDEVEAIEELGDVAELEGAEPADELEELDDLEELSEEAEPVAELDEADELEELDDLDEVEAIEELEDVAELEGAEPAEELDDLDEVEAIEELDDVAELEEAEPVAELDAADELEELDDLEELSEEAEPIAELVPESIVAADPEPTHDLGQAASAAGMDTPDEDFWHDAAAFVGEIVVENEAVELIPESEWLAANESLERSVEPGSELGETAVSPSIEQRVSSESPPAPKDWMHVTRTALEMAEELESDSDYHQPAQSAEEVEELEEVDELDELEKSDETNAETEELAQLPGSEDAESEDLEEVAELENVPELQPISEIDSEDVDVLEEFEEPVEELASAENEESLEDSEPELLEETATQGSPYFSIGTSFGASSPSSWGSDDPADESPRVFRTEGLRPERVAVRGVENVSSHHIVEIDDFVALAGRTQDVITERDGLAQIAASAYFAEIPVSDRQIQTLAEQVLLAQDVASIDDVLGGAFSEIDFGDIMGEESTGLVSQRSDSGDSSLRLVSGGFELPLVAEYGDAGVRQIYRQLVRLTRRWDARVAIVLEQRPDGSMIGNFGLGMPEECDVPMTIPADAPLVINVVSLRRVALLKQPLSSFEDFGDGSCHARKTAAIGNWLLLPLRDTPVRRYLMVGFSRSFQDLTDLAFQYEIIPRAV